MLSDKLLGNSSRYSVHGWLHATRYNTKCECLRMTEGRLSLPCYRCPPRALLGLRSFNSERLFLYVGDAKICCLGGRERHI